MHVDNQSKFIPLNYYQNYVYLIINIIFKLMKPLKAANISKESSLMQFPER